MTLEKLNTVIKFLQNGENQNALTLVEEVLRVTPDDINGIYLSGLAYITVGDIENAYKRAVQGIKLKPSADFYTLLGDVLYLDNSFNKALDAYQKALDLNNNSTDLYYCIGNTLMQLSRASEAIDYYNKAIEINPVNDNALRGIGSIYIEQKQYDNALSYYEKAVEVNPSNAEGYANIGVIYKNTNHYKEAIIYLNHAIALNPNNSEDYEHLGECYFYTNQFQEALDSFLNSIKIKPEQPTVNAKIADIYYIFGKNEIAIEYYEKIKSLSDMQKEVTIRAGNDLRYEMWKNYREHKYLYKCNNNKLKFAVIYFYKEALDETSFARFLEEMQNQTYKNFEVIRLNKIDDNFLKTLESEYSHICFVEQNDLLHKEALLAIAQTITTDNKTDIIYTDEDIIDEGKRIEPSFKVEFSPLLLLSHNYMDALLCLKINEKTIGALKEESEINHKSLYKIVLSLTKTAEKIKRIPDVLYHRNKPNSLALETTSTKEIIEAEIIKAGYNAQILNYKQPNLNIIKFLNNTNPKISILIPFKDKLNYTKRCVESIESKSTYKNYEIILIDNRSEEQETLDYLKQTKHKVLKADIPFNFAKLNNMGAEIAQGEYLLFLNNDMSVISEDWLETTLGLAQMPQIGIVGAKLLFESDLIQHVGLIRCHRSRQFFHMNCGRSQTENLYKNYIDLVKEFSVVTGAFMMISKAKFDEVEGFDEAFLIEKNDVDLCLKTLAKGYTNVFNPHAVLYHYESISRKNAGHITPDAENYFQTKWIHIMGKPDPHHNPNFSGAYNNCIIAVT